MRVKNIMEEIVLHMIEQTIRDLDCCHCEKCRSDIAAYVLNNIPPKYVVSEKGELFSKLAESSPEVKLEILKKLAEAANIVKAKPRHDM